MRTVLHSRLLWAFPGSPPYATSSAWRTPWTNVGRRRSDVRLDEIGAPPPLAPCLSRRQRDDGVLGTPARVLQRSRRSLLREYCALRSVLAGGRAQLDKTPAPMKNLHCKGTLIKMPATPPIPISGRPISDWNWCHACPETILRFSVQTSNMRHVVAVPWLTTGSIESRFLNGGASECPIKQARRWHRGSRHRCHRGLPLSRNTAASRRPYCRAAGAAGFVLKKVASFGLTTAR